MISITERPIAVMAVFSDSVQYETLHYTSLEQSENVVNLVIQDKQILFIKKNHSSVLIIHRDKTYNLEALKADKLLVKPNGTFTGTSYPIGVDPVSKITTDRYNSTKSEISCIDTSELIR